MNYFYALIIILVVVLAITALELVQQSKLKAAQVIAVRNFQDDHDLSGRDLKIFKDVLKEAKEQIIVAENALTKMSSTDSEMQSALDASKEIFMYLMDQPKELIAFGDFLYRNLPAFSSSLERLQKLQNSGIETEDTSASSQELLAIIMELSQMIIDDFESMSQQQVEQSAVEKIVAEK